MQRFLSTKKTAEKILRSKVNILITGFDYPPGVGVTSGNNPSAGVSSKSGSSKKESSEMNSPKPTLQTAIFSLDKQVLISPMRATSIVAITSSGVFANKINVVSRSVVSNKIKPVPLLVT